MAYQVFVQQVAFLEGLKNLPLAKETLPITLENIHARVSALERLVMGHPQPPPTTVPDWESLRYRTTRLYRTPMGGGGPRIYALVVLADHWWPSAEESDEQETAVALERTLRSLGVFSYSASSAAAGPKKEVVVDDGETVDGYRDSPSSSNQFDIAVQEFCHLAGQKRKQPMRPLETPRDLYAAAFELSLVLEGKPASPVQYPPPPGYHAPALPNTGMPGGVPPGVRPPGAGVPPPPPRWHVVQVEKKKKKKTPVTKSTGGLLQFMAGKPKPPPKCTREHVYSDSDSDDDSIRARTGWRRWLPRWLCRGRSKKTWNGYETDSSSGSSSLAD
ncbi:hypothetical protein PG984_002839 [Apiospora sp. TS-2023a]